MDDRKRPHSGDGSSGASKRPRTEEEMRLELERRVAELNKKLLQGPLATQSSIPGANPVRPRFNPLMQKTNETASLSTPGVKSGLAVPAHPLLLQMNAAAASTSTSSSFRPAPLLPRPDFSTVKANQRLAAEKKGAVSTGALIQGVAAAMGSLTSLDGKTSQDPAFNPYLQPSNLKKGDPKPKSRKRKQFQFVKEGRYVEMAEKMRTEARLEKLKQDIAENVKKAGIEKQLDLVADAGIRREPPPNVEWWDAPFLGDEGYEKFDPDVITDKLKELITNLVQHPIPIDPPDDSSSVKPKALMLTKKEQKKLRRQRRLEQQKEKREKIRLGLLPPEQPKVKISNLMRVLGEEAVLDPTQIEARVRQEMAARQQKHEDYIAANKLTDEQRKEKLRIKLEEDTAKLVHVAVFRIKDLSFGQHKFKVNQNAQQYNLTGVAIVYSGMNLVVVEGGPKGIKKYKNLMLRRIDWSKKEDSKVVGENEEEGTGFLKTGASSSSEANAGQDTNEPNECVLVWEGQIKDRQFSGFRFKTFPTETMVKSFLQEFGTLHYWESARNFVSDMY